MHLNLLCKNFTHPDIFQTNPPLHSSAMNIKPPEITDYIEETFGVEMNYHAVYALVHYQLLDLRSPPKITN